MTPASTVAATIGREQMIPGGERVLAAFSGGADSTALVLLLHKLGCDLVLGHVDHGMRPDSGYDAGHCAEVAGRLGLPFLSRRVSVNPPTQAQARLMRYQALEEMAAQAGASRIATGHTLDDQAETVRMRLDRGGFGLGIPPVRGRIVRPLLDLRRADTEQVCREAGIRFVHDPSNENPHYRRVAVRRELASATQEDVQRLAELADRTRLQAAETAVAVQQLWERSVRRSGDQMVIERSALRPAAAPVASQLVRRAAGELGVELTSAAVSDILRKVVPVTGARLDLPAGVAVWSERSRVVFGRYLVDRVLPEMQIFVPGTTRLPAWELSLSAAEEPRPREVRSAGQRLSEVVDASEVGSVVTVRQWRPGDRFHPLGSPGTRKLQDFFVDAGIPRSERSSVPIVSAGDRIVWVAGHRLDDRFKVTAFTSRVLRLTLEPAA
ncbi:MAG TPA: tRNA lysidine(34) synthetase TilS [Actinomycetota bacterium]|nr:tRNA lysidine(34) synthetase TilS [Actinomycetota bacterium]